MRFDIATLLNVISTIAIVGALVFTGLQVRAANRTRQEQAAIVVIQTTQNADWTDALALISTLPTSAEAEEITRRGETMEQAMIGLSIRLETIGYMVYCRIIPMQAVNNLIGGVTLVFWSRAQKWTENYRVATNNPRYNEWCEWLADRIGEYNSGVEYEPAHRRYKNWRGG